MSRETSTATTDEPVELKRVMGPKLLLLFVVGDIVGAGVYAVTGQIAGIVGGIVWLPFLLAFVVASLTALSYLELVTKYPHAAGAALYTHKAFGIHFVTFLVAFAVVCSGITSSSTSAKTLADNFSGGLLINGWIKTDMSPSTIVAIAMVFMILLAVINLRGVGESVKFNVVLTLIELAALSIVIGVGFYAMSQNGANFDEIVTFRDYQDRGMFLAVTAATSIAFFAMVGFEDAVNMVEEVKDPNRIFPKIMLTGLGIAVLIYMLVAIAVVTVLTAPELKNISDSEGRALLEVVSQGAPGAPIDKIFPFLAVFAVANTALINMLMASRLLYGMAKQGVLPRQLGAVLPGRRTPWVSVLFSTALALGLIFYVTRDAESNVVANLSNVTAFLLLCVFAIVNVACLILRRDSTGSADHFVSPGILPILGAFLCVFLAGPWVDRPTTVYVIAGGLMLIGVGLWFLTYLLNLADRRKQTGAHSAADQSDSSPDDAS